MAAPDPLAQSRRSYPGVPPRTPLMTPLSPGRPPHLVAALLACLVAPGGLMLSAAPASAHPMSRELWSLRNGIKLDEQGLALVSVLEIPDTVVVQDIEKATAMAEIAEAGAEHPRSPAERRRDVMLAHRKAQFDQLAAGMSLTIDGEAIQVAWAPHPTPVNGRASAGFFQFIIAAELPASSPALTPGPHRVELSSQSYRDLPMVYSGLARDGGTWVRTWDSAQELMGEDRGSGLPDDPRSWSKNEAMRTLAATFEPQVGPPAPASP